MKQETPEEVAERLYPMVGNEYLWNIPIQRREGFIAGAEWQQERSYSEQEVLELIIEFSKWQLPQTEEDVLKVKEWFKQFKNK